MIRERSVCWDRALRRLGESAEMNTPQVSRLLALPAALRSHIFRASAINVTHAKTVNTRAFSTTKPLHQAEASGYGSTKSSVNEAEVSHFKELASSWWDPDGSSRLLHLMNPLRHKFIRQCLNSDDYDTSRRLNYLDIGCGGGIFAESAARLANTESVTAIDPTPEVIAVAKAHRRQDPLLLQRGLLDYQNIAIEDLPIPSSPSKGCDILTLFEVIEHINKPSPFLQNCLKHIKPGGWLIGSTIARTNTSWFTTKLVAEDLLRLVPRGTHDWNQYIQPHELRSWARSQSKLDVSSDGWQVVGVVYVPGLGWKEVQGSEDWGNYFFGIRRKGEEG